VTNEKISNKTQFEQFKAALSTILSIPKSSLPSKPTKKKPRKK